MFSPLKAPSVFYTNGTPERSSSRLGRQNSTTSSKTARTARSKPYHIAPLRTPKSMSFLRGGRDGFTHKHDEGVQQARDRFFQHAAQERLREQPSFLFRSRTQKPEKAFRKSVRSGSGHSDPLPELPDHDTTPSSLVQNSKLREKARKASKTLKFKLKRVFGLIKDEPVVIPNQQVEAHETHVRQYSCPPNQEAFEDIPYPDSESLSRVASRQPSLRILGSKEQLRSHAGSVRSAKSFTTDDDNSRVTSWTSTAANTIGSAGNVNPAKVLSEREQQRLSIIQENGTHISSSSFRRKGVRNQFSAYPLVRPPSRDAPPAAQGQGVDSARVYSALMKRLDECSPKPKLTNRASEDTLRSPRRSTDGKENQKYATIRHVRNDSAEGGHTHHWVKSDSVHSAKAEDVFGFTGSPHIHQWVPADGLREKRMRGEHGDGDVFTTPSTHVRARESEREPQSRHQRAYSNASTSVVSIQQPSNKTSFYTVPEEVGRTPQEIALRNEPVVIEPTKRLRESRSTFFGGSTMTISRTTSPFRQAMQSGDSPSMRKDEKSPARKSVYLAVDGGFDSGSMEDEKADSVSLYSRTTSGQTLAANSALSLLIDQHEQNEGQELVDISDLSVHDSSKGDVVIIDRSTYRSLNKRDTAGGHQRDSSKTHSISSSAGSNEWKRWMSSEVAKLERGKENRDHKAGPLNSHPKTGSGFGSVAGRKEYINYALPKAYQPTTAVSVGHLRESAQIDDEDVEVSQGARVGVRLPAGMVQVVNEQQNQNSRNGNGQGFLKPILKNKSSVSLIESSGNILPALGSGGQHTSASCGNTPASNGNKIGTSTYIPIPPPIPGRSPLRNMQSKASLRSVGTVVTGPGTGGRNVLHKKNVSKASLRSCKSFTMDTPCATPRARLVKRKGVPASQRQVGSMRGRGREGVDGSAVCEALGGVVGLSGAGEQNDGRVFEREESEDFYGVEWGVGGEGESGVGEEGKGGEMSESDAQALGSRKMVELFLSSRRKRIAGGSEEGGVFL